MGAGACTKRGSGLQNRETETSKEIWPRSQAPESTILPKFSTVGNRDLGSFRAIIHEPPKIINKVSFMTTWNFLERKVGGFYHLTSGKSKAPLHHNRLHRSGLTQPASRHFSLQGLQFASAISSENGYGQTEPWAHSGQLQHLPFGGDCTRRAQKTLSGRAQH